MVENIDKPRVIHIDDEEDFLKIFAMKYKKMFNITSLKNAGEALVLAVNEKFDAIITDYNLRDMNGLQLISELRRACVNVPVIFYTGQGNEEIARKAFLAGASDYFVKEIAGFAHKEKVANSIMQAIERKRAEEARLESENKLRHTFDYSPVGAAIVGLDRKFQEVNDEVCRFLGYSPDELIGLGVGNLTHPEDMEKCRSYTEKIFRGELEYFETDIRCTRKDGKVVWGRLCLRLYRDKSGIPLYFLPIIIDVDRRKRAEQELERSKELYQITIDALDDMVHLVDENFNLILYNKSLSRLLINMDMKSIEKGRSLFDNFRFLDDTIKKQYEDVLRTGEETATIEKHTVSGKMGAIRVRKIPVKENDRVKMIVTIIRLLDSTLAP